MNSIYQLLNSRNGNVLKYNLINFRMLYDSHSYSSAFSVYELQSFKTLNELYFNNRLTYEEFYIFYYQLDRMIYLIKKRSDIK